MNQIKRKELHMISRHSDLSESRLESLIRENIYPGLSDWRKFIEYFLFGLALTLISSAIVFFFAYNWAEMHKLLKLGLLQVILIIPVVLAVQVKIKAGTRNILLTVASFLVGILFAVFGQIYQTGADAFQLFFAWFLLISGWVFILAYPILWFIYIFLLNLTIILYGQQIAYDWDFFDTTVVLFLLNSLILFLGKYFLKKKNVVFPSWLFKTIAVAAIVYATSGIIVSIVDNFEYKFLSLYLITVFFYFIAIIYSLNEKDLFLLSVLPFSVIIIFSVLIIRVFEDHNSMFFNFIFIVASVSYLINSLLKIQKSWKNNAGK